MTGEQFKKIRKLLGLNQLNLGHMMGLSRRTIQGIEAEDQVKVIYQHSLFWIALRDHNISLDEDYEPIANLAPDWLDPFR